MDPKTYAYIQDGVVWEVIPPMFWDAGPNFGEYIPLDQRYPPQFCANCVDITDTDPQPQQNWLYDAEDGTFTPQP